jgi:hypothetical protein
MILFFLFHPYHFIGHVTATDAAVSKKSSESLFAFVFCSSLIGNEIWTKSFNSFNWIISRFMKKIYLNILLLLTSSIIS